MVLVSVNQRFQWISRPKNEHSDQVSMNMIRQETCTLFNCYIFRVLTVIRRPAPDKEEKLFLTKTFKSVIKSSHGKREFLANVMHLLSNCQEDEIPEFDEVRKLFR